MFCFREKRPEEGSLADLRPAGGGGGTANARHIYFAYWFVGHGRETHSHYWRMIWTALDRVFRNTTYSWAYVSLQSTRSEDGKEFEDELVKFTPLLHAGLLEVNTTAQTGIRSSVPTPPSSL